MSLAPSSVDDPQNRAALSLRDRRLFSTAPVHLPRLQLRCSFFHHLGKRLANVLRTVLRQDAEQISHWNDGSQHAEPS